MPITYTSGEQVEVYRFNWPITIGVPATALFLQAWLPQQFPIFAMLDLPLLVTIFFAVSRRNQVQGLFTGAVIGLLQDSMTNFPLGVYGLAKTLVAYARSSPDKIRGRLMPVIVYDPRAGRDAGVKSEVRTFPDRVRESPLDDHDFASNK